ncbi:MAG TPA: hypothetical protein VJP80_06535 [Candidatus Saccharimonadales bacterium]|nr:hypothetical protein [Candidatus Saccharimonadales bacterium]
MKSAPAKHGSKKRAAKNKHKTRQAQTPGLVHLYHPSSQLESAALAPKQIRLARAFAAFWGAVSLLGLAWVAWFNLAAPPYRGTHHDSQIALSLVIALPSLLILMCCYAIFRAKARHQYRLFISMLGALLCLLLLAVPIAALFVAVLTGAVLYVGTRDLSRRV